MKTVIFGPFIGEFGWELSYWHGWVRKLAQTHYSKHKIVVSSYKRSYPLYSDFINEFVPISDELIKKNYICSGYFPDPRNFSDIEKKEFLHLYKQEIKRLQEKYVGEVKIITHYPQRKRKHLSQLIFLLKKVIPLFKESELDKQNPYPGLIIKNYIKYLFFNEKNSWDVQTPPGIFQKHIKLSPSTESKKKISLLINNDIDSKFVTIFARNLLKRKDKNWKEQYWKIFVKLLVDDLDLKVFLCGLSNASFLEDFSYRNVYNTIGFDKKDILDLQIACLNRSNFSIHSLSGTIVLSMQCEVKTFFFGDGRYEKRFKEDNLLNSNFRYYTDEGLNPDPYKLFEKFKKYYFEK